MWLDHLTLRNFRNYIDLEVQFPDSVNLLVGSNAQGKTNLLEAIYFTSTAKSHRTNSDRELVHHDSDWFFLRAEISVNLINDSSIKDKSNLQKNQAAVQEELTVEASYQAPTQKRFKLNGYLLPRLSEWVGQFQVVFFSPESLILVKGSPGDRRRFLDQLICQVNPFYLNQLQRYQSSLRQRNELLKQIRQQQQSTDLLKVWDELLVEDGVYITQTRASVLRQLQKFSQDYHSQLTQSTETLYICYCPSLESGSEIEKTDDQSGNHLCLGDHFRLKLQKSLSNDIVYGSTSVGPHRDEFKLLIQPTILGGTKREVKLYGSQGQQRTVALSLKLGEVELIHNQTGNSPVVLLDDVLSELDDIRSRLLFGTFQKLSTQTFITATKEEDWVSSLPAKFSRHYRRIVVEQGKIVA